VAMIPTARTSVTVRVDTCRTPDLVEGLRLDGRLRLSAVMVPLEASFRAVIAMMLHPREDRARRAPAWGAHLRRGLLAVASGGNGLVNLLLHRLQVEGGRLLPPRELDGGSRDVRHPLLHQHEAPELTRQELIDIAGGALGHVDLLKALERVLANVGDERHADRHFRPWPASRLV
jgi:hypothetical protein